MKLEEKLRDNSMDLLIGKWGRKIGLPSFIPQGSKAERILSIADMSNSSKPMEVLNFRVFITS